MSKNRVYIYLIPLFVLEFIFLIRGNKILALAMIFFTFSLPYIILFIKKFDLEESSNENRSQKINPILKEIYQEMSLAEKTAKKYNLPIGFSEKIELSKQNLKKTVEQYGFIIENYGQERAKDNLLKIENQLNLLKETLEKMNDYFLKIYIASDYVGEISPELDLILEQLNASLSLKEI
ncbi:hypothetical protein JXR93_08360 [bacterium]|nr:hypothetical protein [bacterium]